MKKRLLLVLVFILLLAVLGGVLAFAFRPTTAVQRALAHLAEAATADFSANLKLTNSATTKELLGEEANVDIAITGVWERQEGPDNLSTNVGLTTQSESVSFTVQGQVRLIKDKLYILIEKTPQAFPALVNLRDQWSEFD